MTTANKSREDLLIENERLRLRLEEAEETLRAIGSGEVDAFVVSGPDGEQVFTLKGAEQPYRVLVETMNEGAATLACDGTILYCNNRLAAMLHAPLEKLIGKQLGSYVTPEDLPLFMARLESSAQDRAIDEITMITGIGDAMPVLVSCGALGLSECREISVVVTDLTQQKRNEEVMAAEILARAIIEQAGEAIVVCDERGVIIRASRRAHDLCGENLMLKSFNDLFRLRMPETASMFSILTPLRDTRLESVEVEFKRNDEQVSHFVLNAAPLKFVQNRISGCVVTLTDISGRKRAEEELRQSEVRLQRAYHQLQKKNMELQAQSEELQAQNHEMARLWEESRLAKDALTKLNAELEQRVMERTAELAANIEKLKTETVERVQAVEALREKEQMLIQQSRQAAMGEMIGNIAHQWRQPLNTLGLTIQQLLLYYDLDEFSREFLDSNVKSAMDLIMHMSNTIDDFRNYFRPEKEKFEFKVREAVANTLSLLEGSLHNPWVEVEIVAQGDPVIYGFQNEFAQVLLNVLINARDALMEREINDPKVTITIGSENGCSSVIIADNAGGIPEEIMDRIFDPYFTTKGPHRGTGVGLFMSKVIIEKNMGGKLAVRNSAEGAEFTVKVFHGRHS